MALALGQPVGSLARLMSEAEFQDWQHYAARRMLPWRRMELYLAQIAFQVAGALGGAKNKKLADYLFDPIDSPDGEPTAEEEAEFFGFKPRNRKPEEPDL